MEAIIMNDQIPSLRDIRVACFDARKQIVEIVWKRLQAEGARADFVQIQTVLADAPVEGLSAIEKMSIRRLGRAVLDLVYLVESGVFTRSERVVARLQRLAGEPVDRLDWLLDAGDRLAAGELLSRD